MTRDDFYARFQTRPLSHSQLEAWRYDKEQWYERYILGKEYPANALMKFGTRVGDAIGTPDCPIPDLNPPGTKEFRLDAKLDDIIIVGYADHFCPQTLVLHENKTTDNPTKWDQQSVDKHPQLTMYALMLYLRHDIPPKDVKFYLNDIRTERYWAPLPGFEFTPEYLLNDHVATEQVRLKRPIEWHQYETRRTGEQLAKYVRYVEKTVEAMYEYATVRLAKAEKY